MAVAAMPSGRKGYMSASILRRFQSCKPGLVYLERFRSIMFFWRLALNLDYFSTDCKLFFNKNTSNIL